MPPSQSDQRTSVTDSQTAGLDTHQHLETTEIIDTTATAHRPGPQNPGECRLYFAERHHLHIVAINPFDKPVGILKPWYAQIGAGSEVPPIFAATQ
jgi:hypothetical protein